MPDAAKFFDARRDGHGGVTLTMRRKFRDQMGSYIGEDGVARPKEVTDAENGDDELEHVLQMFGPTPRRSDGKAGRARQWDHCSGASFPT